MIRTRCSIALAVAASLWAGTARGQGADAQVPPPPSPTDDDGPAADAPRSGDAPGAPESGEAPDQPARVADLPRETAQTVADAPAPDDAHGFDVAPAHPGGASRGLRRAAGFVPLWVTHLAFAPVRGLLWVYESQLSGGDGDSLAGASDLGIVPQATYEAGFGLNLGATVVHRSLLGEGERASLTATALGATRASASLSAHSGDRWGGVRLGADVTYANHRRARFFGFGNLDEVQLEDAGSVTEPVDPLASEQGFSTRYSYDQLAARLGADIALGSHATLGVFGGYTRRVYDPGGEDADRYEAGTSEVYEVDGLAGYDAGLDTLTGSLVLHRDRAGVTSRYNSLAVPSTGYRATGGLGYARGLGDDPSNFGRLHASAETFVDLYAGNRVLALRASYETALGDRTDIPFDELPTLGGSDSLRGYVRGRFRDRSVAAVGAEYWYPILDAVSAFVFVDAGVPFSQLDDVAPGDARVGFGAGMQFQTLTAAIARLDVASSIDGGLLVNFVLRPAALEERRAP